MLLSQRIFKLLTEKKAAYPDYCKAKEEMQELLRARRNVELFFAEEKDSTEKTKFRLNDDSLGFFPHGRVLGYLFCYKSVWNKRAACIGTMQNKWGLGIAQQAFLQSKIAFVYTNALLAT